MAKGTLEESANFAAKLIKKNPDISMAELKKAAKPKGIRIYPLAIGKAKVSLGMGKKKAPKKKAKRGKKKVTKRKGTRKKTKRRKTTKRKATRKKTTKRKATRKKPARRKTRRKKATRRTTTRRKTTARRGPGRPKGSKIRRRSPGRLRKAATPAAALGQIAKQMRDLEKEVASLRSALSKIADLAGRA